MHLRKSLQIALRILVRIPSRILALASLSSPHFDANRFLNPAAMCPIYRPYSRQPKCRIDGVGVAIV